MIKQISARKEATRLMRLAMEHEEMGEMEEARRAYEAAVATGDKRAEWIYGVKCLGKSFGAAEVERGKDLVRSAHNMRVEQLG